MPEGPEVEFTRLSLKKFEGNKIQSISLTKQSQKYNKYKGKQRDFTNFSDVTLKKIERHGKFLIWVFDCTNVILNHLGMSGKWLIQRQNVNKSQTAHPKVVLSFQELTEVAVFDDVRNFGQFRVFETHESALNYQPIKKLGPDGLKLPFPFEEFKSQLEQRKYANKEIGSVLLDQKLIAGVGNIYKSESLALANISPLRLVKNLSTAEIEILSQAVSIILNKAVKSMGSSIQTFRTPYGDEGSGQNWHKVYAKKGKECENCGSQIERVVQDKRSTFYCKNCQK